MGVPRGGRPPTSPTLGEACQHRDNPYLPTPATLTYHKGKVCRRFGDRLTFSLPGLAAVSLSGNSGAVSVIGSAPGSACVRVFETAIQIRQVDGAKELPDNGSRHHLSRTDGGGRVPSWAAT